MRSKWNLCSQSLFGYFTLIGEVHISGALDDRCASATEWFSCAVLLFKSKKELSILPDLSLGCDLVEEFYVGLLTIYSPSKIYEGFKRLQGYVFLFLLFNFS